MELEIRNRKITFGGESHTGWLPEEASTPHPTPVEDMLMHFRISNTDGGFILEWWDDKCKHRGDTWHQTVQDAIDQAKLWFGVLEEEWKT